MKNPLVSILTLLAVVLIGGTLHAASGTWNTTVSGNWSDDTKWLDGNIAAGAGFTATFTAPTPSTTSPVVTISVDNDRTIGNLVFSGPNADGIGTHNFALSGPGILTLSGGTPTITANLTSARTATVSATLAGTQGVTFTNTDGELIISGNNTYSGATVIAGTSSRVVTIAHNNALGSTSHGTTVNSLSGLLLADGITVTGESLTLSSGGGTNSNGALRVAIGGTAEWAGAINISNTVRITAGGSNGSAGNLKISGVISGAGNLDISGLGTTTFTHANTYAGHTRVYRGTLKLDAGNNRLPTGTTLIIGGTGNNATLELNGYDQTVANFESLAGAGTRTLSNSADTTSVFTVNQTTGTKIFDGIISGDIDFVKSGGGTLNLTGTANTFTGNITVNGGTLGIASAFINNTADVSLFSGAVFNLNFSGTDTIGGLYFDDVAQQIGTYGSIGSTATYQSAFFTGSGILNVTSYTAPVPEPSTYAALFGAVILGACLIRRRRG